MASGASGAPGSGRILSPVETEAAVVRTPAPRPPPPPRRVPTATPPYYPPPGFGPPSRSRNPPPTPAGAQGARALRPLVHSSFWGAGSGPAGGG